MSGGYALDTNVAIYAFATDEKAEIATVLLEAGPCISVQLLNEFANASLRKHRAPWREIEESLGLIMDLCRSLRPIDGNMHEEGCRIAKRYKLGFYDSLMLAAARLDDCDVFFSEDMQHGLVIDNKLTITNPFVEAA